MDIARESRFAMSVRCNRVPFVRCAGRRATLVYANDRRSISQYVIEVGPADIHDVLQFTFDQTRGEFWLRTASSTERPAQVMRTSRAPELTVVNFPLCSIWSLCHRACAPPFHGILHQIVPLWLLASWAILHAQRHRHFTIVVGDPAQILAAEDHGTSFRRRVPGSLASAALPSAPQVARAGSN